MEENITKYHFFKGDRILWIAIIAISLFSILPVYSASSNLVYIVNNGTTSGHLIKHIIFIIAGLFLMRGMSIFKYEYIGKLSIIGLICSIVLLIVTMFMGQTIEGASASRWITIPGIGLSFQPSSIAYLMLIIYLCWYLTKSVNRERLPIENIIYVFGPILLVFVLVAKDNGSTALMILMVSIAVLILGGLGWKYIVGFISTAVLVSVVAITVLLKTDVAKDTRIHTWASRIEAFTKSKDQLSEEEKEVLKTKNYQVNQAKAAIVHGKYTGVGPGKSALKQKLPQSASDFIFAIIIEEYGIVGTIGLLFLYSVIIFRIIIIANKMPAFFGTLLVLSLGVMFFLQLSVNIAVALNLIPVTGQPLPLISYGGTSMLVTYALLGIILNVSSRIQIYDEEGFGRQQSIEEINDIA
ncbi:FtsW/RodA/SpoVE family cell cycle protein [Riemerella columbina]|uniref:FtsW/RodA/SpoVE family cell cycle protein n=1 Tax=Riemerella columbina TaxID=103810 RepID=UPI0026705B78|nr:FtsW/RodA/SpoVE family cell cycle protein [Riemerella columbina]WKS95376.1 FtsW/RodA/SpoVE family cell cycle protein [Riemerella columbina]